MYHSKQERKRVNILGALAVVRSPGGGGGGGGGSDGTWSCCGSGASITLRAVLMKGRMVLCDDSKYPNNIHRHREHTTPVCVNRR